MSWWADPKIQRSYHAFHLKAEREWSRMAHDPEAERVSSTRGLAGSTAAKVITPAYNANGDVA